MKGVLERFADAPSCIDQCFIADVMLEQPPTASRVGKTIVGGIDVNKARIRLVIEAVIALSAHPTASPPPISPLGCVPSVIPPPTIRSSPRRLYDLKKLRGKHIVCRIGRTRRYEPLPGGLRATALVVLCNKAIKPLLAASTTSRMRALLISIPPTMVCRPAKQSGVARACHRR